MLRLCLIPHRFNPRLDCDRCSTVLIISLPRASFVSSQSSESLRCPISLDLEVLKISRRLFQFGPFRFVARVQCAAATDWIKICWSLHEFPFLLPRGGFVFYWHRFLIQSRIDSSHGRIFLKIRYSLNSILFVSATTTIKASRRDRESI